MTTLQIYTVETGTPIKSIQVKEWGLEKETTFAFGQFTTISGHFLANYSKALRYTASRSADLGDTLFLIGFQNT